MIDEHQKWVHKVEMRPDEEEKKEAGPRQTQIINLGKIGVKPV